MKNRSLAIPAIAFILALSTSLNLHAGQKGYYRWTDVNGTVQSSDHPPQGVEAEFIDFTTYQSASPNSKQDNDPATVEPAAKLDGQMEALIDKDPELCKQAQNNLEALKAARIRITEADGSKRLLTEDEKENQRDNARAFIDIHC